MQELSARNKEEALQNIADLDPSLFDSRHHFEALALLAAAHLAQGDAFLAFRFADRRCRFLAPNARDFLLRAEASRLDGRVHHALDDLAKALEIDPTDIPVNRSVLNWGPEPARPRAASQLISDAATDAKTLKRAIDVRRAQGERVFHRLKRADGLLRGWLAWDSPDPLAIAIRGGGRRSSALLTPDPDHPLAAPGLSTADVALPDDDSPIVELSFLIGEAIVEAVTLAKSLQGGRAESPAARPPGGGNARPRRVSIVVPMYEDFGASRNCLESLRSETIVEKRIIVVDDCSPNAELRDYLNSKEKSGEILLIRNEINSGFAASTNQALALCESDDVILLNSDALAPPGVIDQLVAAAYSDERIGTVTPLSNNGEFTSFPRPNEANPLPTLSAATLINERAAAANGDAVVDMPNGIGFCLYIKAACLASVGFLSRLYSRGYFEDVEFCLKAREHGFRNVCATGVFVGHAGTSSFRADKRALVIRNRWIIEARFPEYRKRCLAFVQADPLKPARAAIEVRSPPDRDVILICSGVGHSRAIAEMRRRQIAAVERDFLIVICAPDIHGKTAILSGAQQDAPRSLSFPLEEGQGFSALGAYLAQLKLRRIEILDANAIPDPLLTAFLSLEAPTELLWADLQWLYDPLLPSEGPCREMQTFGPCAHCLLTVFPSRRQYPEELSVRQRRLLAALKRADSIRPADRMAEAFAKRVFKDGAVPLEPDAAAFAKPTRRAGAAGLGVLAPSRSGLVDQLVVTLGRKFAQWRMPTEIIVFGRCVDDLAAMASGNVFVTGDVEEEEYGRLFEQYGIAALILPYRTCFFGLLDRIAERAELPKAYFDWSFGSLGVSTGDLSMDPRICDVKAAHAIADWRRADEFSSMVSEVAN